MEIVQSLVIAVYFNRVRIMVCVKQNPIFLTSATAQPDGLVKTARK